MVVCGTRALFFFSFLVAVALAIAVTGVFEDLLGARAHGSSRHSLILARAVRSAREDEMAKAGGGGAESEGASHRSCAVERSKEASLWAAWRCFFFGWPHC